MKIIERIIHNINENAVTLMAFGAIVALTVWFDQAPRVVACLWLALTACNVAEQVRDDRKHRDMFVGQLNVDGTWKVPTQERIRR